MSVFVITEQVRGLCQESFMPAQVISMSMGGTMEGQVEQRSLLAWVRAARAVYTLSIIRPLFYFDSYL